MPLCLVWVLGFGSPAAVAQLGGAAGRAVGEVERDLRGTIERTVESPITDTIGPRGRGLTPEVAADLLETLDAVADRAFATGGGATALLNRVGAPFRFTVARDGEGAEIEAGVALLLISPAEADRLRRAGVTMTVTEVPGLDAVLARISARADLDIVRRQLRRGRLSARTRIDFNHLYHAGAGSSTGAAEAQAGPAPVPAPVEGEGRVIGLIDSAIAQHESLHAARIEPRDFLATGATPSEAHGTAIASVLVGASDRVAGVLPGATVLAAGVFFEQDGWVGASTESLVRAIGWMIEMEVRVVNMSLTGPPNRLLEQAISVATDADTIIVAAVGNAGPDAPPLYPAAYPDVIGITAVDGSHTVFDRANRGKQVAFATYGVGVPVAALNGGYTVEDGTSIASAYAAAYFLAAAGQARSGPKKIVRRMSRAALDLGAEGYDVVYGFGLIRLPDH